MPRQPFVVRAAVKLLLSALLGGCFATSPQAEFRGALVYKSAEQVVTPGIPGIAQITFDQVLYDTCGCWDGHRNRFVIPAGVTFVRLNAQAIFQHGEKPTGASNVRQIVIKKNFETLDNWYYGRPGWAVGQVPTHIATTVDVHASGPVLPVRAGDTFLVDAFVWDGPESHPVKILGINGTWFAIEIVH
jgi:hypothetical protein